MNAILAGPSSSHHLSLSLSFFRVLATGSTRALTDLDGSRLDSATSGFVAEGGISVP